MKICQNRALDLKIGENFISLRTLARFFRPQGSRIDLDPRSDHTIERGGGKPRTQDHICVCTNPPVSPSPRKWYGQDFFQIFSGLV